MAADRSGSVEVSAAPRIGAEATPGASRVVRTARSMGRRVALPFSGGKPSDPELTAIPKAVPAAAIPAIVAPRYPMCMLIAFHSGVQLPVRCALTEMDELVA
jgi:hypothetical protein